MNSWKPHVTVATVVPDGGRYLFVEERVDGRCVLNQPAGHLEAGESLVAAARREALEETAHEIEPSALLGVYRWQAPDTADVILRFAFAGEVVAHHPERELDDGILRCLWLTRGELDAERARHRSGLVARCVAAFEAGRRYPLALLDDLAPAGPPLAGTH